MARSSARALWAAKLNGSSLPSATPVPTIGGRKFTGRVLGIDPSLRGTGLSIVDFSRGEPVRLVYSQTLKIAPKYSFHTCLGEISREVGLMITTHRPDAVAAEETIYVQNFRTAQILGAARGAALGIAASHGLSIAEYPPLRIKQAVCGFGRASKEQVQGQVKALLRLTDLLPSDEADATAAAICYAFTVEG
ncbi:MAG: crossover junction endodeoxyribonuclease RuvC [Verrucomicrobiota bacterium JB022]|nr:crossover junction endodeoxyribonuclease RuvC [Verrucomicrobiota bacterium JB022]